MSAKEMKALREAAGLTQVEMAARMDMGRSSYIDLEADDPDWKKFKRKHQLQLERLSLSLAVEKGDINLALPSVRRDALDLARLVTGG
ncbi:MAG: helix-turn-helix domain-containing protein [Proteobacteria bacterium]|nr:helix-turn-helix domain-containing protein [Pseudomonadota bacterium]